VQQQKGKADMKADELFGNESGLPENPSNEEIREAIDRWLDEFRKNILQDMDGLIRQTAGTPQEAFWREKQERYAMEITELEKEIRTSN